MGSVEQLPAGRSPYTAPRPIHPNDRLDAFDCGNEALNDFLRLRALKNEGKASRTYVVCSSFGEQAGAVVAYYSVAAGAVTHEDAPGWAKRNMPNPLPVVVLGRLAVDHRHGGKKLGVAMLRAAMQRALDASRTIGARAMLVHAIDDDAIGFYTQFGFQIFPAGTRTLFLPMESIAATLG